MATPIVSMFSLSPSELRANPALLDACKVMGLRAEMQCCRPLTNDESDADYARNWDDEQGEDIAFLADRGIRIIARLDDAARTPPEQSAARRSQSKLAFIGHQLRMFGTCDGVEVCDEMGADPATYPLKEIADAFHGLDLGIPTHNPLSYLNTGIPIHHLTIQWPWWKCKNGTERLEMLEARVKLITPDWGTCLMLDVSGAYYRKNFAGLAGDEFTRANRMIDAFNADVLLHDRVPPSIVNITKQLALAERHGIKRLRLYQFDAKHVRDGRALARLGERCETGVKFPSPEWDAIVRGIQVLRAT